jgi:hypothetical protein
MIVFRDKSINHSRRNSPIKIASARVCISTSATSLNMSLEVTCDEHFSIIRDTGD